jgi:hypothetical protein
MLSPGSFSKDVQLEKSHDVPTQRPMKTADSRFIVTVS